MLPSDQEAEAFLSRQIERLPRRVAEYIARLRRARRVVRLLAAVALIAGGLAWFLPLVGLWMLPVGLLLLADQFQITKRIVAGAGMYFARRCRRRASGKRL